MNQRMRYWLLFVLVFLLSKLFASGSTGCWECAEKEFYQGEYRKSALSFELIFYSESEDSLKARALLGKLTCLEKLKNKEEIERCFNRLAILDVHKELEDEIQIRKIWYFISVDNFSQGEFNLSKLDMENLRKDMYSQAWLARYTIALKKEDQREALSVYNAHFQDDSLDNFYVKKLSKKHLFKSTSTAKTLSTILPGLGQLYAGRPDHMLYSLALIGGSVAYTVGSFLTGYYVTGVLTGIPFTLKFYLGGRQNAGLLVDRKNKKIIDRLLINKNNKFTD